MRSLEWRGSPEGSDKNSLNSHQNSHLTKMKKATSRVTLVTWSIL
jgi:hypothetical protein